MVAALFDFDGTLYTGHVWQDLSSSHWSARRHRRWVVLYVVRNMALLPLYKLGLIDQIAFYRPWGETMAWLLRGWTVMDAHALFERLGVERILPNLRADVLALLRRHQAEGHVVALVSGTFAPWLEIVARELHIDHVVGTPLQVRDGRYTGRIVTPLCQGRGKLIRVRDYFEKSELNVDWMESFAYADSGTDLPLLRQVGHPVAVYPDEALHAEARALGWPVIGEEGR